MVGIRIAKRAKLSILKDISGIIRPSRMTLLLGPPSSGKSTFLKALAGRLDSSLKVSGDIAYNGYKLEEFVPQKTAGYVSQNDVHVGAMTVKETLKFSARCQGVRAQCELQKELSKREKAAGIHPDVDVDLFMKAISMEGGKSSDLLSDYIIRMLGLGFCADSMVGNEMIRGISGGEMKRVTIGEVIVGLSKVLFMDEISNGLDSSTTYQTIKCLQQIAHFWEVTILMSLLQPAPETFNLFDDIILLSEGHIVYHGPRDLILEFFESCGFRCPEQKCIPDFLQEVTLPREQAQYWADHVRPYRYVSVPEFANHFSHFHIGANLKNELKASLHQRHGHHAALVFNNYVIPFSKILVASFAKEWLLLRRNSFVYVFKFTQAMIMAIIMSTVFWRKHKETNTIADGILYLGAVLFALITNLLNGIAEISLTIARLPVFYKHQNFLFYPTWIFTFPIFVLKIPFSMLESTVWVGITYSAIGFAPEISRFFKHLLVVFLVQQMAIGLFRAIAGVCRTMTIANMVGTFLVLFILSLGGFMLPKDLIPVWWAWAYWVSPIMYAFNALAVNEFFSPRWMDKTVEGRSLGMTILENVKIFPERNWYWIGVGALLGFVVFFNVIFTIALTYLKPFEKLQVVIDEDLASKLEANNDKIKEPSTPMELDSLNEDTPPALFASNEDTREKMVLERTCNSNEGLEFSTHRSPDIGLSQGGIVLPFLPLTMTFDNINYHIDMPSEMKKHGKTKGRIPLLNGISGAFRPGMLTALMGESGAGKTTLLDVLSGRKTGGYIKGDIKISGYSKKNATFTRVSGYCEQYDIHSPHITVKESLIYSAFLRLPVEVNAKEKMKFVNEMLELVELNSFKDVIVGLPGVSGLSTEQRKRLTIAAELVANPSIIFMDEPTSGLDARAAAIVTRIVRNMANTGRTIVCTIHQPSIDIFETFDELLLIKMGQVIYSGALGQHSEAMIKYFEAIPGVMKIEKNYNPAAWVLEISSKAAATVHQEIDFANYYKSSYLYQINKELMDVLSKPVVGSKDLYFPSKYSVSLFGQFKSCLWKQWLSYWRSPGYNLVRLFSTLLTALFLGSVLWRNGHKREDSNDFRIAVGSMVLAIQFVGVTNSSTVQPIVSAERSVFYRERGAGMYSSLPYALAQVIVEIPYVLFQSIYYSVIIYSMLGYQWTAAKFLWFTFISFFTFLYYTYYGMMTMSISPNHPIAAMIASSFNSIFNLFSGFFVPKPKIPHWWIWYYRICPLSWTIYGLIASQYGDMDELIRVPGQADQSIKTYVKEYFGYDKDLLKVVAIALVAFPLLFALIFAFSIQRLNFQQR